VAPHYPISNDTLHQHDEGDTQFEMALMPQENSSELPVDDPCLQEKRHHSILDLTLARMNDQ
jgi:hypothetical protein